MFELFSTPRYCQWNIHVHFSQFTGEWNVEGKSYDRGNVKAYNTYGTNRINGYKIMEETLNLKDVRIFDYFEDENGKKTAVLNKKETAIAQGKQELIKQAFADWIWSDPERREQLTKMYNEKFNSLRPREYDGSHMSFVGINPKSLYDRTKSMRLLISFMAATHFWRTSWVPAKPLKWSARRRKASGSAFVKRACLSYPTI
jgi:N12 class adenine-specific DNA methylase